MYCTNDSFTTMCQPFQYLFELIIKKIKDFQSKLVYTVNILLNKTWITFCAMKESNPEVGSSQNINGGSVNTSEAKESLFISPPDIPFNNPGIPITVFWHLVRANWNFSKYKPNVFGYSTICVSATFV